MIKFTKDDVLEIATDEYHSELMDCILEKAKGGEPFTFEIASMVASWLVTDIDSEEFEETEIIVDNMLQEYVELVASKYKKVARFKSDL